ncbi:hypothetical protein [Brevundimonas sp.]|uniref:hypothetical protein n=1 Tax=Brevundimonas sp. TaxID=1871086 RepID=UPI002D55F69E|nr:hypothetical protein [Brevundimonas sp.]HYC68801.1 hypothetical protein [Brevundimonas sp.]
MDEIDQDLDLEISEIYEWLCVEALPDQRPRLNQVFTLSNDLPGDALELMAQRDWLRPQGDGRAMLTAKGLAELKRRGFAPL